MACRSCGHPNPPRNRFCGGCGTPLEATCPSCRQQNPPGIAALLDEADAVIKETGAALFVPFVPFVLAERAAAGFTAIGAPARARALAAELG